MVRSLKSSKNEFAASYGAIHECITDVMGNSAMGIGAMFLDRELNIKLFTPSFTTLFNIYPADIIISRPPTDLNHNLKAEQENYNA